MIHKIKSTHFEVKSHGQRTIISSDPFMVAIGWVKQPTQNKDFNRARVKKMIWHLQDILKCMNQIHKAKEARKLPHPELPNIEEAKK